MKQEHHALKEPGIKADCRPPACLLGLTLSSASSEGSLNTSILKGPSLRDDTASPPGIAATAGNGIFKSTDAGLTWKAAGRELERTVVRCVAADPAGGDSVYAGTDGGVFVSPDGGKTWERRSSGLPRAVVYALAIDPADPARVFAGTAAGLFESRDGARTWSRASGSDADIQVTSLALDAPRGRLYAGTLGRGIVALSFR